MGANVVELLVKDRDTAKPDLDALRARLGELGATVARARAEVEDGDAAATLDKLSAQLTEIGNRAENPKIKLSGALRAEAQVHAVEASLSRLGAREEETGAKTGRLSRMFSGLKESLVPSIGEMSLFQKVMLATNIATTFAEPLLAGLAVTAGALASGLTAAGGGLGAFGLLAKANLTAASAAATAAQSAQTQYTSAVTAANAAYSKQMGSATTSTERQSAATAKAAAIQEAYKAKIQATTQAYAGLSPAQVQLSKSLGAIQGQWQRFTASFAGPTATVVRQVRPLITDLLPDVRKLAMAGEAGISSMLSVIGARGTGGLNRFVNMLANEAPQAIMKLGIAVAHVGSGIGGILKAFMPSGNGILSGLDKITAKFATWGQTLSQHSGFQSLMAMFKSETPLAVHDLGQLAGIIKTVVADMTGLSGVGNSRTLLELASPVLALANALLKANPQLVRIALYLLAASSGAKKLGSAFSGIKGGFGALKTGVSALKHLHAGLTDSAAAASDATGAWGTFGGTLSKLKFSNLKAGFNDADAAASDATGVLGTLGGKLSSIGSGLASAASAVGSFVATYATKLGEAAAATGTWIAEQTAAAATFIAENVAMAASATVAFIAENAATLGIVAGLAALVAGIVYVATHWKQVWHGICAVVDAAVGWLKSHWKLLPAIFLGPIGMVATLVLTHLHDIEHFFEDSWHEIEHLTDDLVSFVRTHWQLLAMILATVLLGPVGTLVAFIATHWNEIRSDTARLVSDVVGFFERLPGRILGAISALGSMLYSAGAHMISMLASGIESMAMAPVHAAESIVGHIADLIPHSPAKRGPLSGSGSPDVSGRMLARMFAQGIGDGIPGVASIAARMARATAAITGGAHGTSSGGSAGAAGALELLLRFEGGDSPLVRALFDQLKGEVRKRGGGGKNSAQIAWGQTH